MQLEIITNDRKVKEVKAATVSMMPKLKRVVINRTTLDMMVQNYKNNFNNVVLLKEPESTKTFWIQPCNPEQAGARKLSTVGKNTKIISCSPLFHKLSWISNESKAFLAVWDIKYKALKIELEA